MSNLNTATPKAWYASKTLWGSIIGAASLVAGLAGFHVDPQTQSVVINEATATAVAVGGLVSVVTTTVGRLRATQRIG